MAITPEVVARIAELARLEIEPADVPRACRELSAVLDFMAVLDRLDLGGLEPTTFAAGGARLRPDEPDGRTLAPEAALAAAPAAEHGFFLVPPVVENLNP